MRWIVASGALILAGCPAPRLVSGVVFGRAADDKGVHALVSPVEGASVTWSCPANVVGPAPQTLKTDYEGRFKSKETHIEMPETCELLVEKEGFAATRIPFAKLRDPSRSDSLRVVRAAVELRRATPEPTDSSANTLHCLDLPKALGPGGFDAPMLGLEVGSKGLRLNGKPIEAKDVFREAREAKAKEPEVRAIITADRGASYGDVLHGLDLLKQGGIAKIALGIRASVDEPFDNIAVDGCAKASAKMEVVVLADGSTTADGVKTADLLPKLRAAKEKNRDVCVVVTGDKAASHGAVVHTLEQARTAKIAHVAFAHQP